MGSVSNGNSEGQPIQRPGDAQSVIVAPSWYGSAVFESRHGWWRIPAIDTLAVAHESLVGTIRGWPSLHSMHPGGKRSITRMSIEDSGTVPAESQVGIFLTPYPPTVCAVTLQGGPCP